MGISCLEERICEESLAGARFQRSGNELREGEFLEGHLHHQNLLGGDDVCTLLSTVCTV